MRMEIFLSCLILFSTYQTVESGTTTGPWWRQTTGQWWRTTRSYGDMVGTTPPPRTIGAEVISNQGNPCLSSPCENGGTCSSTRGEFTCTCPEATSGSMCELSCENSCMDCGPCQQYIQFHEEQYPRYTDTIILKEEPCDNDYIREQCPLTCNTCRPGDCPPEIPQPSDIGCISNMGNPTKCWEIADFRMYTFCANIPYFTKRCSFECMVICFGSCLDYASVIFYSLFGPPFFPLRITDSRCDNDDREEDELNGILLAK